MDNPIIDFFVFRESAFASGDKITKPESQKIGIDTRKPVIERAHSSFPLPNNLRKVVAIFSAAPDNSSILPIITPSPIMIPMLPSVPPNPVVIALMVASGPNPPTSPTIIDAIINAKNT